MPRVPIRQFRQAYSTTNTAVAGRAVPPSLQRVQGPAQAREQFSARPDMPLHVARALDQLQEYIRASLAPIKALPFADGNLIEQVPLAQSANGGGGPYTVIAHGLRKPFRGYHIKTIRNGQLLGHALIANPNPQGLPVAPLDSLQIQLWTQWTAFGGLGGTTVTADVWVYA